MTAQSFNSNFIYVNTMRLIRRSRVHFLIWIYYCLNFGFIGISGIQWLSISKIFSVGTQPQPHLYVGLCKKNSILTQEQQKICRQYHSMMSSVADGASMAVSECQHQFIDEAWNCSTQATFGYRRRRRRRSVFGNRLTSGTKEAAFVYAVSSAAVAYSVTRDCSKGIIDGCGCDKSWTGNAGDVSGFHWGGCSDNIAWGEKMSRMFIDVQEDLKLRAQRRNTRRRARERRKNEITVNLNNNKVGREVVTSSMRDHCKCHGVSSSCNQITCWRSLPDFSEVGRSLKDNYNDAIQVHVSKWNGRPLIKPKTKSPSRRKNLGLVYLRKSPQSCATLGRRCDPDQNTHNSCQKICCGRGYSTRTKNVTTKCRCEFDWCCRVNCDSCNSTEIEHICR